MNGDQNASPQSESNWQFHPGDTVAPIANQPVALSLASPPVTTPPPPHLQSQKSAPNSAPTAPAEAAQPQSSPAALAEPAAVPAQPPASPPADEDTAQSVAWTASEFVAHQKSAGWYILLLLAAAALAAGVYVLTKDTISTGSIIVLAIMFSLYGARKPRVLAYRVDSGGLTVGDHFYDYGQFRSFAIMDEGAFSSIVLMPLRRFMPLITVYFEPQDEDKILQILSEYLPMEQRSPDVLDSFIRKIRF